MGKVVPYIGGVIGGFSLLRVPLDGTFLASLDPVVDIIGVLAVLVFAGGLIYQGIKAMVN